MEIPADWTFKSETVARGFDRHVREQLPWYELATGAIAHVARHYIPDGGLIYDIGASTGNIGRALAPAIEARNARLVAIESSPDMVALYDGPGEVVCRDALEVEFEPYDLGVLFLTLMFVPVYRRPCLLSELRKRLRPGGALVIFDKNPVAEGYAATVMWRLALAGKLAQGVSPGEIIAKELSLAGAQRPLLQAPFGDAVEFFRFGEFAGWLIEG